MKHCRLALLLCALSLPLTSTAVATAQGPQPRLAGEIVDSGTRVELAGSALPRALRQHDLGPVSPALVLHGITLVFRPSAEQQAALDQLLAEQQHAGSPQYHHWLTPEDFAARFGMAQQDLDRTSRWLAAQGFTVTTVSRSHQRISFSGTAAQVQAAFGTSLHRFQIDGEVHTAPASDLTLPAQLAPLTSAVLHLSDLRPKPLAHPAPRPAFTSSTNQVHYLTPADLLTMYHQNNTALDGTGHSIAVVGQSFVNNSTTWFSGSYVPPTMVLDPGTGVQAVVPGDESESDIDLEYSSGIAPKATLFDVYVGSDPHFNVFDALSFAVDTDLAEVISISYSECEAFLTPSDVAQGTSIFQQANAQGQTIVAAAGDTGSTGCVNFQTSSHLTTAQQQGLAVGYPADSPNVTAVGGTQMAPGTFAAGTSSYWDSAAGSDVTHSLLSYVPEVAWNEDQALKSFAAGGGGASALFAQPSWQAGLPGVSSNTARLLPDIALQASITSPGFILCTSDPDFLAGQGQTSGCINGLRGSNQQPTLGGGTSFAAPVFAGLVTLLNQQNGESGQGNINPTLYHLASTNPAVFHDITSGTIACPAGITNCSAAGQSGFPAQPGFDEATGLGSLDFGALLSTLAVSPPSSSRQTSDMLLAVAPQTPTPGQSASVAVSVVTLNGESIPSATRPTGTVVVSIDGTVVSSPLTLEPTPNYPPGPYSQVTFSFTAPATPGSHIVSATYPGDSTHTPTQLTSAFTVGSTLATGSVALSAGNVTLPSNGSASTTVSINPTGGYNGRLTWTLSLSATSSSSTSLTGCYSIPTVAVDGPTSTTLSLGTGTACSSALPAARPQARVLPLHASSNPSHPWRGTLPAASAALLLVLLPATRRRPLPLLCLLVLATTITTTLTGCGGGVASNPANPTNPSSPTNPVGAQSTYLATLSATDSVNTSIQSSTTFTLTIQQ